SELTKISVFSDFLRQPTAGNRQEPWPITILTLDRFNRRGPEYAREKPHSGLLLLGRAHVAGRIWLARKLGLHGTPQGDLLVLGAMIFLLIDVERTDLCEIVLALGWRRLGRVHSFHRFAIGCFHRSGAVLDAF